MRIVTVLRNIPTFIFVAKKDPIFNDMPGLRPSADAAVGQFAYERPFEAPSWEASTQMLTHSEISTRSLLFMEPITG